MNVRLECTDGEALMVVPSPEREWTGAGFFEVVVVVGGEDVAAAPGGHEPAVEVVGPQLPPDHVGDDALDLRLLHPLRPVASHGREVELLVDHRERLVGIEQDVPFIIDRQLHACC